MVSEPHLVSRSISPVHCFIKIDERMPCVARFGRRQSNRRRRLTKWLSHEREICCISARFFVESISALLFERVFETSQLVEKLKVISSFCMLRAKIERKRQCYCKVYSSIKDFFNRLERFLYSSIHVPQASSRRQNQCSHCRLEINVQKLVQFDELLYD